MNNKKFKKIAVIAGIIAGVILTAIIVFWSFVVIVVVNVKYAQLPLKDKIKKTFEVAQSFINTEVLNNAPACNAPEVNEGVKSLLQENYLVDNTPAERWVDVGGGEGSRYIVGKLSYDYLNLYGITIEKVDKEAKKNSCAGTLFYQEVLNENGEMGDEDRKVIYTDYTCRIFYETQKTLDDNIQLVITGKECKQGAVDVEENLD